MPHFQQKITRHAKRQKHSLKRPQKKAISTRLSVAETLEKSSGGLKNLKRVFFFFNILTCDPEQASLKLVLLIYPLKTCHFHTLLFCSCPLHLGPRATWIIV